MRLSPPPATKFQSKTASSNKPEVTQTGGRAYNRVIENMQPFETFSCPAVLAPLSSTSSPIYVLGDTDAAAYDAIEHEQVATPSTEAAFRGSWKRPKWDVAQK